MLKVFVSKLEDVDEKYRDLYKKSGDGFVLQAEKAGGFEIANTTNLMTSLEKERDNAKTAEAKLKGYGDITPEQAKTAVKKAESLSDATIEEKVAAGIRERESQLISAHDAEKVELGTTIDRYKKAVHGSMITASARKAINDADGNPDLLEPILTRNMRLREDGDKFHVEIIDDAGVARIGGTEGGVAVPMTLDQRVTELKEDKRFHGAFKSSGESGGGADGGGSTSNGTPDTSKLSPVQKLELGHKQVAANAKG